MDQEQSRDILIRFIEDHGFIFGPEPEIYGGLAGFFSYGPLGKALKNKIENVIRQVYATHSFWEVECPTILPAQVWQASGHLGGFTDPLVQCTRCKGDFRIDKLIEEKVPDLQIPKDKPGLLATMKQHGIKCPNCGSAFKEDIMDHSLMLRTTVGVDREAYNRPETATATYLPFKRYFKYFRTKLPFGVFQIGKAYRNEISPRQHSLRGREFTQAEAQIFVRESEKNILPGYDTVKQIAMPFWTSPLQKMNQEPVMMTIEECYDKGFFASKGYAISIGIACAIFEVLQIPKDKLRLRQHHPEERAFYALDAWDLEIKTASFGWVECCGIHDRTDYDLKRHSQVSGEDLRVTFDGSKEYPHILEIAMGPDRMTFVMLDLFFDREASKLRIPPVLAPLEVGVYPLLKNEENLVAKAREVTQLLRNFAAVYDDSGSIGRRYARADEVGVPFGITIDFDTLKDNTVTVRDRDTTEQVRIPVAELLSFFEQKLRK